MSFCLVTYGLNSTVNLVSKDVNICSAWILWPWMKRFNDLKNLGIYIWERIGKTQVDVIWDIDWKNHMCSHHFYAYSLSIRGINFLAKWPDTVARTQIETYWYWVIPENIHTIPQTAFRISEGEGGVHDYRILRALGGGEGYLRLEIRRHGWIPQVGFLE